MTKVWWFCHLGGSCEGEAYPARFREVPSRNSRCTYWGDGQLPHRGSRAGCDGGTFGCQQTVTTRRWRFGKRGNAVLVSG